MASPTLEFHYDISCPFAYIASTRVEALAARTGATLLWKPALLGAIYRATAAPQGAAGSASDVFNSTKKAVTAQSMQRTLRRYGIAYNPPPQHPRKTVNALRLLYAVDAAERTELTKRLYRAYWVEGRDVNDDEELLRIVRESGIASASRTSRATFSDTDARKKLETATAEAIDRGAPGVPGFWIPEEKWVDFSGEKKTGRLYWGQDRMHFVEASLLALKHGGQWGAVSGLKSLMPRCIRSNTLPRKVKVEFWFDFSSPWAFLGWTQLQRLRRAFGPDLEIVMKPFLLGILFREIGAPNMPMLAISPTKAMWSRQDHADWTRYWNAVNAQEGSTDANINFHWADIFPIRTPTLLRCAIVDTTVVPLLWGYNGANLIQQANAPDAKAKLRTLTAEAKASGICGVPTYRVFHQNSSGGWENQGGVVWGQDETNVVEDLVAGWDVDDEGRRAEVGGTHRGAAARL
ncbi:thioredoxin-like protein [Lentithecium fluviatile CBS 122367]|uniref:Thioredoxin-like protein n=1 Tax=Lentithecium fluviatile CBS 122367 TaxID=1168545 RepID=A0A6G1IDJ5_9PLEO|nr:thioredoxin-like protein [Lentithecium fluviatile CBS 122367]